MQLQDARAQAYVRSARRLYSIILCACTLTGIVLAWWQGRLEQHDHTVTTQQNATGAYTAQVMRGGIAIVYVTHLETGWRVSLQKPPRLQPFLRRDQDVDQRVAMFQPGRTVTLCGPDGVGKSALAVEGALAAGAGRPAAKALPRRHLLAHLLRPAAGRPGA